MQHRYVVSSLFRNAEETAWKELAEDAAALGRDLLGPDASPEDLNSESLSRVGERLTATGRDAGCDAMLVDRDGRVLARSGGDASPAPAGVLEGTDVDWSPPSGPSGMVSGGAAGHVTLADGDHLALSYPVERGAGRLIVHRSKASVRAAASGVAETFSKVGWMSGAWMCVLLGITVYMITDRFHGRNDRERAEVESTSLKRIQSLVRTQDAVIFGLAKLADSRDPETGDHLERISVYSSTLASAMRRSPKYAHVITPTFVRLIGTSSALHDIGKVGIEDSILLKPGPLTAEERTSMQKHTTIGGDCLREIERRLGSSNFLQMAREIALAHHERWDGKGYPCGLSGESIPLSARIISVCDVYDALSSRRVYKAPMPHWECVELIRRGAGTQFDPDIIEVWLSIADQFRDQARRYSSSAPGPETGRARLSQPVEVDEVASVI